MKNSTYETHSKKRSLKMCLMDWTQGLAKAMITAQERSPITLAGKGDRTGKGWNGTSLPLLPNISGADVKVGTLQKILQSFGINKKENGEVTLNPGPNYRANRYLIRQYKRMTWAIGGISKRHDGIEWTIKIKEIDKNKLNRKERKKIKKGQNLFWVLALQLLLKSTIFRTAVINKVLGRKGRWFHRDISMQKLKSINNEYEKIAGEWNHHLTAHRTWIESPPGKLRPLTVSTQAWRIYTSGLGSLLEHFMDNSWPKWQHAYKTGRGSNTAWKKLLKIVDEAKFIYEFDLVGYFNSVRIDTVGRELLKFGVPKYITWHLMSLCSGDIENITPEKLMKLTEDEKKKEEYRLAWTKYEFIHKHREGWRNKGLPQGSGISPILSILPLLCLEKLEEKGLKILMYADDGIIYGDERENYHRLAEELLHENNTGATLSTEKSEWVKINGVWAKNLKFLGLTYYPTDDTLGASTRKGSKLTLAKFILAGFTQKLVEAIKPLVTYLNEESFESIYEKYEQIYEKMHGADRTNQIGNYDEHITLRHLYQRLVKLDRKRFEEENEFSSDEKEWLETEPEVNVTEPYDIENLIGSTEIDQQTAKNWIKDTVTSFMESGWESGKEYIKANDLSILKILEMGKKTPLGEEIYEDIKKKKTHEYTPELNISDEEMWSIHRYSIP
uniref:Reverse transcriptase domain-containing protein n=1 Tax=Morchella importuna TaxID=1174673 RepID=A0A650AFC1_9PEZI|nr:hypothetical protein [Morchella importuna]QGN66732.1 hypothetical protein [Morchella importuna]